MVFRIEKISKRLGLFVVSCNNGQAMEVNGMQIVNVMLQGYNFVNAYLTKKGFAVQTDNGVRYIQIPMDRETARAVANFVHNRDIQKAEIRAEEKAVQKAMATAKPRATVKQSKGCLGNRQQLTGTHNNSRIVYKGQVFNSAERLCAKFNRDVSTFNTLRAKGYSMDEALGLMPLRPVSQLQSEFNVNKALDRLDSQRGEY